MLLYVHVPFCRSKCAYCSFFSFVPGRGDLDRFPGLIAQEAVFWSARLDRPRIATISLGGGTPSLLSPSAIAHVLTAISSSFTLDPGLELTMEANPESSLGAGYLDSVVLCGVDRLSLGVQSLNDRELRLLGRAHTGAQALDSFALARKAGFAAVNLDLMFGLPGQTLTGWLDTLSRAVALSPEHLSCYGLTVEPGTRLAAALPALPGDAEQADMFLEGAELLRRAGYDHYEISNFARPGMHCRHNTGYWQGCDYLGLGPGAVSTISGRRWKNPEDLSEYARRIDEGTLGTDGEILEEHELMQERVMLSLRTSSGMEKERLFELFSGAERESRASLVRSLQREGLLLPSPERVILSERGMLLSNEILAAMLPD
jgi:putative oxygen-independent coproporphyrinogen III oxidase